MVSETLNPIEIYPKIFVYKNLYKDIDSIYKNLKESDGVLAIEGHSDGHFISETYNIAKSERRAHAIAKGVQPWTSR